MNDPSQHELDDELLSAYLDDELSTEERVLVESRLAADSAARQTLEQLRGVSQSLRDLPTQAVGRDLRDSILRRAAASRGVPAPESTASNSTSPTPSPQLPNITIGRTTRGWVWASLAIAAALLIMVVQPGREQNADLPNVALNTNKDDSVTIDRQLSEKSLEELTFDKVSPPAAAPESKAPSISSVEQSAPASRDVAQGRAAGSRSESFDASAVNDRPSADTFAAQAPAEMSEPKSAAPELAPAAPLPPAETGAAQRVVVHVLAKRAAFENKAFDELLRKNGVNVESSTRLLDASDAVAAREPASAASSRLESQSAETYAGSEAPADDAKTDTDADVEMVLVEAPSSTIFSCMDALNKDANNYLGVSVDDSPITEEVAAIEKPQAKKLAIDMSKFNRGIKPQQQDKLTRDNFRYFQSGAGDESRFSRERRAGGGLGGLGGYGGGQKQESLALADGAGTDQGSARRLQPQTIDGRAKRDQSSSGPTAGFAPPTEAKVPRDRMTELNSPAAANPERMQVLFVLHPSDDPAPSLKAKNQPE